MEAQKRKEKSMVICFQKCREKKFKEIDRDEKLKRKNRIKDDKLQLIEK